MTPRDTDRIVTRARTRAAAVLGAAPARLVAVDVAGQRLFLVDDDRVTLEAPVSTAAAGLGGAEGSLRTPPGVHVIAARIGEGAPTGAVFESRELTGAVWKGEVADADLILTRVLTLDGREDGINRGPGCDSLARYVYIHGTNHEEDLGRPVSHGCIRVSNADAIRIHAGVRPGDAVVILEPEEQAGGRSAAAPGAAPAATSVNTPAGPPLPDPARSRFHYAGVAGSGMSALAQFQALLGGTATGSDRMFDQGGGAAIRAALEKTGVRIVPQDGSGIGAGTDALIVSTAVERSVPDVRAALDAGVPVFHRSELLAALVAARRTIAVAGTSGKSTVVAMIFEMLRGAGRDPSLVTGGDLLDLAALGYLGNAWVGGSDLLVVEADESDGSLVRYEPAIGVVLNLDKDHKEESEVSALFDTFRSRTRETCIVGERDNLAHQRPGAVVFGFSDAAAVRGERVELGPDGSAFTVDGLRFRLPVPGRHNVENALAAVAGCRAAGVALADLVDPLSRFKGVGRRFQVIGTARGVSVVDDFGHNPAKIRASLDTAHLRRPRRVLAVFQPHGFGPTRFLRNDLVDAFAGSLQPADRLWLLDIFYAGGTAQKDISSADLAADLAARGVAAGRADDRGALAAEIAAVAEPGDLVLVMGARDPSLTALCREILARLT